jgi:hypothetical protein
VIERSTLEAVDREVRDMARAMEKLQAEPTLGGPGMGIAEWDWRLWRLGRRCLASLGVPPFAASVGGAASGQGAGPRDVYLATQVYADGGHTALIGDFIGALGGENAWAILTDLGNGNPRPLPETILSRMKLPADRVILLDGPSHAERLDQLFAELLARRPDRLFLFHHPTDPLPSIVAQPEIARERILVHHADATLSFGLHVPGLTLIDLNRSALAPTALGGRRSVLLPLTAPDPGVRPRGFRVRGGLVTASSGTAHKFGANYAFGYAETVAHVLRATRGSHVHIGPLPPQALDEIAAELARYGVPSERFVQVTWTPSLATTLWTHDCDLFLASFPVDGARTKAEVLATGTPYLRHTRWDAEGGLNPKVDAEGIAVWRTWEDLAETLSVLEKPGELEALASLSRAVYERSYHPEAFARRLRDILTGSVGPQAVEPREIIWELARLARAATSSTAQSILDALQQVEARLNT